MYLEGMRARSAGCATLLLLLLCTACAQEERSDASPPSPPAAPALIANLGGVELDAAAESYVRLVLDAGRHDDAYVDAYYGPPAWREAASQGPPKPIPDLLARAREIQHQVEQAPASARRTFLQKQLRAVNGFLRAQGGERMSLRDEARVLFDIDPAAHTVAEFDAARARLETLLPGEGDLSARVTAFRDRFIVPKERLNGVMRAVLQETRSRTTPLVPLPRGEAVMVRLVSDKPWGAYNWYLGNLRSRIDVNTDLPAELGRLFPLLAHEGYPGHHTYNALVEDRLVRGRGWIEYTVYPLLSPQSLLAEGTADVGLEVLLDEASLARFRRDVLAPLAGLEGQDHETYAAVLEAVKTIEHVRPEAARMLLDENRPEPEVLDFLVRYGLESPERARKTIEFARAYRSYVYTYTVGEELVRGWIGTGPDRARRFVELLQRPVTPGELAAGRG